MRRNSFAILAACAAIAGCGQAKAQQPAPAPTPAAVPDQMPPLAPDVEQCIYRVAQEAVANVVHHAGANVLAVQLACQDGETRLSVHDDGVGFEVPSAQQRVDQPSSATNLCYDDTIRDDSTTQSPEISS